MKFKPGDRIVINKNILDDPEAPEEMKEFIGKKFTINNLNDVGSSGNQFYTLTKNNDWYWPEDCLSLIKITDWRKEFKG